MDIEATIISKLKQLEERLWISEFRFDKKFMQKILADDFFEFGRSGKIYTRDECINVARGIIDVVIPLSDFKVHKLSDEVFQVTYKSIVTCEHEIEQANRSSIWLKTANGLKLKFHQGTKV